jgi:hypothetical protein
MMQPAPGFCCSTSTAPEWGMTEVRSGVGEQSES